MFKKHCPIMYPDLENSNLKNDNEIKNVEVNSIGNLNTTVLLQILLVKTSFVGERKC